MNQSNNKLINAYRKKNKKINANSMNIVYRSGTKNQTEISKSIKRVNDIKQTENYKQQSNCKGI